MSTTTTTTTTTSSPEMSRICYCDHCSNNTCTTQQNGLCFAEFSLNTNLEVEQRFNCFNQESPFLQNLICNDTSILSPTQASGTYSSIAQSQQFSTLPFTNKIVKCCKSPNYCNQRPDFMPSIEDAKEFLMRQRSIYPHPQVESLRPQYSSIPIEIKIIVIILSGLLLVFALALAQTCYSASSPPTSSATRHRQKRRFRIIRRYLKYGVAETSTGSASTRVGTTNNTTCGSVGDDDCSENSPGKVNSDAAIYDTNSVASREPLINNKNSVNSANQAANLVYQSNQLSHPHPLRGPWMAEPSTQGKAPSTLQMTIGSGDLPNKRETSSGSGSGQPYLTQRSIAHDIELKEVVGRGYFGVVWRGDYKGEPVAVKIFSNIAEPSWEREAEIYQTTLLRHKNILGFIATDKRDDVSMTGYWLVTEYYPMGSLFDFLTRNSLSMSDSIRMAFSIANGLVHLHHEIFGTQGKPAIAHRDIKSKNILVKNDGTCCIADLGMAVRYNSQTGIVDVPANTRVGTRRYLAPEVLDNKLNLMDFDSVKATDIYALGLVFWEILRRSCFLDPSGMVGPSFPHMDVDQRTTPTKESDPQPQPQMDQNPSEQPHAAQQQAETPETVAPVVAPPNTQPHVIVETEPDDQFSRVEMNNTETLSSKTSAESETAQLVSTTIEQQPKLYSEEPSQATTGFIESMDASVDESHDNLAIICDTYEAPYQGLVSLDPSTEEMREVVCVKKIRPPLSYRWTRFAPMRDFTALMRECWYEKPQARLSALRIRKSLGDIARHYFNLNMEYD